MELEELKKVLDEGIDPLKSDLKSLTDRISKLEASPIAKPFYVNTALGETYRGYKIAEQGEALREKFASRPNWFKVLSQPDKFNDFVKFMLDVKDALCGDTQAQIKLAELRQKQNIEGTPSAGGYLVPEEYQPELVKLVRENSFALQECTVLTMSRDILKMPTEASMVTVAWVGEGSPIGASSPTFGQVELNAQKLAGLTNGISNELLSDTAVDIVGLLTEQFMYAIGQELDNQVLNGTGNPVSGVLTAAAGYSVVLGSGKTSFSAVGTDDIRNMIRRLSAIDAANAKFIYSKDIQYYIDVLKDGQQRYIYRQPGDPSAPGTLWSRPIIESAKAPLESASGPSKGFIALGNWKYFYIARRQGAMAFASDPYTSFANDMVRFRAITRWGLAIARATAFVRLVTAAS